MARRLCELFEPIAVVAYMADEPTTDEKTREPRAANKSYRPSRARCTAPHHA
jgi:hypothetical protein